MLSLRINGEVIPNNSLIKIQADDSVSVKGDGVKSISFDQTDNRSYLEWYTEFLHSKQLAMLHGGVSDTYAFTKPLTAAYVRSINGTAPDSVGNITLLGSRIVDVSTEQEEYTICVSRLSIGSSIDQLKEAYLFTMRLYDAYNHLTARLLEFSPKTWSDGVDEDGNAVNYNNVLGKRRGTLINYQANVARWNFLVWKSSYMQDLEVSRQNLALSIGYACVTCQVSSVVITTEIEKKSAQPTELDNYDSAFCLTLYRQSVADDRQDKSGEDVRTVITKHFEGAEEAEGTQIYGFGMDAEYKNWDKIKIVQIIDGMAQSDKYAELFALAPGMGVTKYISLSTDSDPNNSKNEFSVTTKWLITPVGEGLDPIEMEKTETVYVAAVNAKNMSEEPESSDS